MKTTRKYTPDGAWGWLIVVTGSASLALNIGFLKSVTLFYQELLSRYQASATTTAWALSMEGILRTLASPLVGALCYRFSVRHVAMLGGFLAALGYILTGVVDSIEWTYLTYGLCKGFGNNMYIVCWYTVVNVQFKKNKGKANALSGAIFSLGCLYGAPLMTFIFTEYGFGGALLIIGGVTLNTIPAAALFWPFNTAQIAAFVHEDTQLTRSPDTLDETRPRSTVSEDETSQRCKDESELNDRPYETSHRPHEEQGGSDAKGRFLQEGANEEQQVETLQDISQQGISRLCQRKKHPQAHHHHHQQGCCCALTARSRLGWALDGFVTHSGLRALTNDQLALLAMFMTCWMHNSLTCQTFIAGLCLQRDISIQQVTWMISIFCGLEIGTRLLGGVLFDAASVRTRRPALFGCLGLLVAALTATLPFAHSLPAIMTVWISSQLISGFIMSQEVTVLSDIVPPEQLTTSISIVRFFKGIGQLTAPVIGGFIWDRLGSYELAFHLSGAQYFLASAVFLVGICLRHHKEKTGK